MSTTEKVLIIHGAGVHAEGDTLSPFVNSFLKFMRMKRRRAPNPRDYIVIDEDVSEDEDGKLKSVHVKLQQAGNQTITKTICFQEGYWSDTYVPHKAGRIAQWTWDWAKVLTEGKAHKTAIDWKKKREQRAEDKDFYRSVRKESLRSRPRLLGSLFNTYDKFDRRGDPGREKFFERASKPAVQNILRWLSIAFFGYVFYRLLSWGAISILLMRKVPNTGNIWKYADWLVNASAIMGVYLLSFGSIFIDVATKSTSRFVGFLRGLFTISIGWLGIPVVLFTLGAHLLGVTFYLFVLLAWIAAWHFIYPSSIFGFDGRLFWTAGAVLFFIAWVLIPTDIAKKYKGIYYAILSALVIPIGIPVTAFLFKLVWLLSFVPYLGEKLAGGVATIADKVIVSFAGDVELYLEDEVQALRILENVEESAQSVIETDNNHNSHIDKYHFVAHSLGSVIAYEALTREEFFSVVVQSKVDTFITLGSPLQKINDLLGGQPDKIHRFTFPQKDLQTPMWVNLYASRDLVADRFKFEYGPRFQFSVATDANVLAAHSAYWGDIRTMGYIVWAILHKDEIPLDLQDIKQEWLQVLTQVGVMTVEDLISQEWKTFKENKTFTEEQFINLQKKFTYTKKAGASPRAAGVLSSTGLSPKLYEPALQKEEDKELLFEVRQAHREIVQSLSEETIENIKGWEKSHLK